MRSPIRSLWSLLLLLALLAGPALADGEVEVLRARRELTGLSGTGSGGSIERALVRIDLRVKDLAYAKEVSVRWSSDDWKSWSDARAYWVEGFGDGTERWQVLLDLGTVGRNVVASGSPTNRADMGPAFVRFAACLRAAGGTYWDNGGGRDHTCALLAPAAQPLPQARSAPRIVRAGQDVLLVGGQEREGYRFTVPDVLRLDPRTGAWERFAPFPTSIVMSGAPTGPGISPQILVGYEAAVVGRKLVLVGGTAIHVGGRSLATLVLDLDARSWKVGAPLPAPLEDRRAVVRGAELHLVPPSAVRPAGDSDRAFVYDAVADAWSTTAVAGLALAAGSRYVTCALPGALALLGGRAGSTSGAPMRDVLVYDAATRRVTRQGTLPCDLFGEEPVCAVGGQLLVANVEPDLSRGTAETLLVDPLAAAAVKLGRGPLLPWRATLGPGPTASLVPSGASGPLRTISTALVVPGDVSRVDVWAPFERALVVGESRTVLRVSRDVGPNHRVTIRGGAAPLSWTRGVDARWLDGQWVLETTELLAPEAAWKPLVDDQVWMPGADLRVRRGETTSVSWSW